jgi:hypothetical protein
MGSVCKRLTILVGEKLLNSGEVVGVRSYKIVYSSIGMFISFPSIPASLYIFSERWRLGEQTSHASRCVVASVNFTRWCGEHWNGKCRRRP